MRVWVSRSRSLANFRKAESAPKKANNARPELSSCMAAGHTCPERRQRAFALINKVGTAFRGLEDVPDQDREKNPNS